METRLAKIRSRIIDFCLRFPAPVCFLVSLFLYFPPLWIYLRWGESSDRFGLMMQQARDPFGIVYNTVDNVLAYRLTVPLLNHVLGLRGHAIVLPSLMGSLLLCVLLHRIFSRRSDPATAFILTLAASLTFLVVSGTTCWVANDSLAFAVVTAMVFLPGLIATTLLAFLALSIDERAIISLLLLPLLSWVIGGQRDLGLRFLVQRYLLLVPGILLAWGWRALIDSGAVFPAPVEHYQYKQIESLFWSIDTYHPTFILYTLIQWFAAFKWFWIFPILALSLLWRQSARLNGGQDRLPRSRRAYKRFFAISLVIVIGFFILTMSAGDQWRCALYTFPFLIAAALLWVEANPGGCRRAGLICVGLLVATPQFFLGFYWGNFFEATSIQMVYPLPLVLARTALEFRPL